MTLLFVLAGMSSYYALSHRSINEFIKERTSKLLIPFLMGFVTIIPVQTYIADVFHNGYKGSFFEHYVVFFTKITDLSGYDGGLTPAHLWFMLFLYVISLVLAPFMKMYMSAKWKQKIDKMNYVAIFALFIVVLLCTPILEIGKSAGESLACFAIGFLIFSRDAIQEKLKNTVWISGIITVVFLVIHVYMWIPRNNHGLLWDIEYRVFLWSAIMFFLGLTKKYFNGSNKWTVYLSRAAFPLYYFHQTVLVVIGYFVLKYVDIMWVQYVLICVGTFIFSLLFYEIFRRNHVTAKMFGIKKKN